MVHLELLKTVSCVRVCMCHPRAAGARARACAAQSSSALCCVYGAPCNRPNQLVPAPADVQPAKARAEPVGVSFAPPRHTKQTHHTDRRGAAPGAAV